MKRVAVSVHQREDVDEEAQAVAIRKMFSAISPRYDALNRILSLGIDVSWRRRAVAEVARNGPTQVLDVCAGTGDLSLAFGEAMEAGSIVVSDFCFEMLQLAAPKLQKSDSDVSYSLCQADATRLPFDDSCFDVVAAAFGIRNVTNLAAGLREMTRVTRSAGRVLILEFSQPENGVFSSLYLFYFKHILPLIGRTLCPSHIDAYTYLPKSVIAFATAEELKQQMEKAGLIDVYYKKLIYGAVTIHVGTKL